jgi:hypothetical protein
MTLILIDKTCKICDGQGWVCENHQDIPWNDGEGCCGGAGAPCPQCNTPTDGSAPSMGPGTKLIWDRERGYLN